MRFCSKVTSFFRRLYFQYRQHYLHFYSSWFWLTRQIKVFFLQSCNLLKRDIIHHCLAVMLPCLVIIFVFFFKYLFAFLVSSACFYIRFHFCHLLVFLYQFWFFVPGYITVMKSISSLLSTSIPHLCLLHNDHQKNSYYSLHLPL